MLETGSKTRSYDYEVSALDLEAAASLSGLEYMLALADGSISNKPSMMNTVNIVDLKEIKLGSVVMEAEPADYLLNPMGTVHGGFAATILDSVMGCAIHTTLPARVGYTTAELKTNFIRPILPSSGRLRAEGKIIHAGRQMATAEGRIIGLDDGKLYAHGSTTCFVFPLKK